MKYMAQEATFSILRLRRSLEEKALSCLTPGSDMCRKARMKGIPQMTPSNVLLLQAVLGALIAVNLKNSLKQLTDPYYLWRKSKLDCVSVWCPCLPVTCSSGLTQSPFVCCSLVPRA